MPITYDHDHENEINFFAVTNFRSQRRKFGIKTDDRRRHVYVIGKTGMGKTTMLENMILNDINAGHGVGVVDPHGDTADKLLDYIPSSRINDVIYFDPSDAQFPVAFNVLEAVNPLHKHLVAQGLMGVFKKIWPDVWSPRMEHILNNCILALLDYPGSTLLGINRILVDKAFRRRVVAQIKDPIVKGFWVTEFSAWEARFRNEAIQPIQNKVGQFLSASIIRNIVAQVKSTIDMRAIMDSGKIIIMNLAKGKLGEETARLLGGMLITKLQLAAMERVDMPEAERRDFYLYVDEFQNFSTESFANILSEARKYRLNIIVAHQYIEQLEEEVKFAVFGNVGTIISFRVGAEDAEAIAKEYSPYFTEEDIVNLGKYDIYLKLMIDGIASNPFSARTLPPIAQFQGHRETIIKVVRERYAEPASVIEDKVMRWSGLEGAGEEGEEQEERAGGGRPRFQGRGEPARFYASQKVQSDMRKEWEARPERNEGLERPARPKFEQTAPVVKVAPDVKPISLQAAVQKAPIRIKLGPPPRRPASERPDDQGARSFENRPERQDFQGAQSAPAVQGAAGQTTLRQEPAQTSGSGERFSGAQSLHSERRRGRRRRRGPSSPSGTPTFGAQGYQDQPQTGRFEETRGGEDQTPEGRAQSQKPGDSA